LATRHGDVLAAVTAVEAAAADVRAVVLAGEDAQQAGRKLADAAATLAGLVTPPPATPVAVPVPTRVAPAPPVTKPVTNENRAARRERPAPLDVDTVRLDRSPDSSRPGWRVLAGDADTPITVGFLEPVLSVMGRRTGRWSATTAHLIQVRGGPWRNRIDALAYLVDNYQRAAARV
jgi:hypothetical protein